MKYGTHNLIWIMQMANFCYTKKPVICIFAVNGGNFTGYYRFLKGFYGLAYIPTIFQEKIDQTLENKHPAWLDNIIVVTKGSKEQQKKS